MKVVGGGSTFYHTNNIKKIYIDNTNNIIIFTLLTCEN